MTVNLPDDLQQFIQAEVQRGHFASEEAALAEAVRLLRSHLNIASDAKNEINETDPVLGMFSDIPEEMDEILEETMKHRENQAWRQPSRE